MPGLYKTSNALQEFEERSYSNLSLYVSYVGSYSIANRVRTHFMMYFFLKSISSYINIYKYKFKSLNE